MHVYVPLWDWPGQATRDLDTGLILREVSRRWDLMSYEWAGYTHLLTVGLTRVPRDLDNGFERGK